MTDGDSGLDRLGRRIERDHARQRAWSWTIALVLIGIALAAGLVYVGLRGVGGALR